MQKQDLSQILSANPYPGRGIVLGLCKDPAWAFIAYFIMGRSENSRNRVFTEKDGGIITQPADATKMKDPSLIIYAPVRKQDACTIVTNGDQTDTVYDSLLRGERFEDALRTRTFEPDAPNFTPRISGLLCAEQGAFSYKLSILKANEGNEKSAHKFFYEYPQPVAGEGHFIHTYAGDGEPLPSFAGEPVRVGIPADTNRLGDEIWNQLNPQNKVSLFVRVVHSSGKEKTCIYNRFDKQ